MGSKNRIANAILPIILKDRKPGQWYVEPFVGGANLLDKVDNPRIGSDYNPFVIQGLKLIRDFPERIPDNVTEENYQELKKYKHESLKGQPLDESLAGVVGFACSFGGKWFRGYARDKAKTKIENELSVSRRMKNNALKQSNGLKGALLISTSYLYLDIPESSIIYCDPPYQGTEPYRGGFEHAVFWDWVREKSLQGHSVFVSEYSAPPDFDVVWQQSVKTNISAQGSISAVESLFVFNDLY